jgi:hypothetical protein
MCVHTFFCEARKCLAFCEARKCLAYARRGSVATISCAEAPFHVPSVMVLPWRTLSRRIITQLPILVQKIFFLFREFVILSR